MDNINSMAAERLRNYVERIERLAEEKDALTSDIREVFAEAKGSGFDIKALRKLIANRKIDAQILAELADRLRVYSRALV